MNFLKKNHELRKSNRIDVSKTLKNIISTLLMLITISITAQQGINYKALIKNEGGNVVASQNVTIQFQILQSLAMTNVYQETHSPTTDANGIVIVNIGEGSVDSGDYATIDWGSNDHYLNVQINTGSGLTDMGSTQFMAVPYALSVANAITKIDDLSDGNSDNDGSNDGSSIYLGVDAGQSDDLSNNQNVGMGNRALTSNTSGFRNTAYGQQSLLNNTTGDSNCATGYQSLLNNTTGIRNTATGYKSLLSNTDGQKNTANGYSALFSNTTGIENIAVGSFTLYQNTTGNNNVATGNGAMFANTIGSDNTAHGFQALNTNTSGNNNTALGDYALQNNTTGSNNTAIGSGAVVPDGTLNNQVRIGNTAVTSAGVQVAWTVTSDKAWKENVRALPYGLDVVKQLKPVDYVRKNNEHKTREMGFIAQDVEALLNKIGYTDQGFLHKDDKGLMSLRYNDFIALLTKAIQEQQEIIEKQNKVNLKQTAELESHKSNYEKLLKRVEQLELATHQ